VFFDGGDRRRLVVPFFVVAENDPISGADRAMRRLPFPAETCWSNYGGIQY
jgi:hypothetical protein